MLTREENERLTQVGPGTAAGELLRRYWYPVGVASELTEETPTQLVRSSAKRLSFSEIKKDASVCSMIDARTVARLFPMAAWKREASRARIMGGFLTREAIVWRRRRNRATASSI